jgi:tetratricopeptide (TPR) repeat protein
VAAAQSSSADASTGARTTQDLLSVERRLQEAAARAPDHFEAHHNLGQFYLAQERLEAAIPHLERSHAIDPSHYVNGHDLALAYVQTGRLAQARQHIKGLLQAKDTAELRNLLGDAEEAAGNLLAAAEEYQKAAHADPTEEHLFDWGNNLLRLRAYQPAADVFVEAVRRHPGSARLQVGLGIARYSRGQFEDAVRSFGAAADLDPDDERPYLFLGEMYGVSAELASEVTRRLARFVEKQPGHALGRFYYAMSVWKAAADAVPPPEVETHLKKSVSLDPRLARAHFQLGVLYSDHRRFAEAAAALEEAVRLDPAMAQAHYRLGQAYLRTGRDDLARKALEAFERLQPR